MRPPDRHRQARPSYLTRATLIAILALAGISLHLGLRFVAGWTPAQARMPLYVVLAVGGSLLVGELAIKLVRGRFGSDLLAGISIITALLLGEYLAGSLVVLMLAGGEAIELLAVGRASSALNALARRMPSVAHRGRTGRWTMCRLTRSASATPS